jgi:two-component system, response regulator
MSEQAIEILMVEDSTSDAELILRALKKNHSTIQVKVATDGEEALNFLLGQSEFSDYKPPNTPKVILLDLKLPKVDGFEVLKIIKNNPKTKLIPVVILTSSGEEIDVVESYQLGANSYIVKPVDFDKFMKTIDTLGFYWLLLNERAFFDIH